MIDFSDIISGSSSDTSVRKDDPKKSSGGTTDFSDIISSSYTPAYTGADKYLNEDNLIQTGMEMIDETNREVPALMDNGYEVLREPTFLENTIGRGIAKLRGMIEPDAIEEVSSFTGDIVESFKRGHTSSALDTLAYNASIGIGDKDKLLKLKKDFDKMQADDPIESKNFLSKAVKSIAQMLPAMGKGISQGKAAGLTAFIAGQVPPLTLLPDEIFSVPVATALGGFQYWYRQGTGSIYTDLLEEGVDDNTSKVVSHLGGALYGAVEFFQIDMLFPKAKDVVKNTTKEIIKKAVKQYGKNWITEVGEEGLQEIVSESSKEIAKKLSGKSEGTTYNIISKVLGAGWSAVKESALPLLLLTAPSSAITASRSIEATKPKQVTPEKPINKPLEKPKEPVTKPEVKAPVKKKLKDYEKRPDETQEEWAKRQKDLDVKVEPKVEPIKEDPISDKKSEKKVTFEEKLKESNEELKTAGNEVSSKIQTEIDRVKNKIKEGKQPKAKVKPTPKGGVKSFDDLEVEKAPTKEPVKQDLKEEAKKFKSAEEFVESQDIIRNTDVNLDEKKSLLKSGDEIDDIGEFTDNFQDELKKFGFKNIEELRSNIEASESILEKEVLKEQQLTDIYNEAHKEPASVKEKVEPKEKVETEEITTTKKDSGDVGIVSGSINNLIGGQKVAEVDLKGNVTEVTKDVSDLEVEVLRLEGLQSKGKLTREELRKSLFGKVLSGSELDMFDNVDKSFKLIQDKVASLSKTKVEPKEKERGFAKSLEDAGLVKGEDDFYKSITNEDTIIQANARIEKSEQGAIQYVLEETESDSAEKTTTAIGLVAKLQKDAENIKSSNPQEYEAKMSQAVEIATKLTQRLTKAGQIVQSASLLSKLSPDGVLVWATKKIDDINKKKPKKGIFAKKQELTTKQVEQFRDIAKKLQESEGFSQQAKDITKLTDKVFKGEKLSNEDLGQIKGFVDEIIEKSGLKEDIGVVKKPRKQSETSKILNERLNKAESDARARIESRRTKKPISKIKSRKGGAISTLPIQDIVDYSIIGASKIGKVGVSFAEWSRSMVEDMGDIATNDLQKIYNRSKNLFNQEKAKSRKINQQAKQLKNLIEKAYSSKGGDQYTSEALSSMADELKNLTGQIQIEKAQELAHAVNALENSSLLKKIATLQTMGHLLNPKTNVRNILGNELFWRLERLNKYGATGIDWTRSELTGSERTVTYKSGNQFNYWSSLLHGIRMGWKGMSAGGLTTQFDLKGQTFKGVFNPLTYMEKALSASLRGFDYAAYNRAVYQTFGEMAELDIINNKRKFKNSKLKQAWINNYVSNVDEATQEIADQAGKYVTFQDENIISTTFSKIKQVLNLGKEFGLGDIVLKYPKTPGNLLARAIDYSPIGIVRGLKIMTDPYRTNADPNPREATLAISRAITGATGLTALGVYLISKGLLTGDDDKDWKVRKLKREQLGESSYQVNLSMFKRWIGSGFKDSALGKRDGDLLYSYDWMQPIAINLAMAANLEKELSNTKGIDEKVLGIAKAGGEAFFKSFKVLEEQPLLRGIRDLFKGYGSVSENLFKVAVGIPSSFVPTFLNQIRQSLSNEARDTWSPNPWQRAINRVMLKMPVISNNLPLAFKSLGEKVPREVYNSDGNTLWNVFLNPGFVAKYKVDPVTQMLLDPYKEEGRKRQIPKIAKRKLKIDGVDYNLEGKDVAKMQMIMANTLSKILRKSKLADNKAMKLLTPEMQEKLLAKLVNASSEIGKRWFIDNRLEDYKGSNDV